jgi:hypothetical protein
VLLSSRGERNDGDNDVGDAGLSALVAAVLDDEVVAVALDDRLNGPRRLV